MRSKFPARMRLAALAALLAVAPLGCMNGGGPTMPDDFDPSKYQFKSGDGGTAAKQVGLRPSDGPGVAGGEKP